jgi:flagellar hook-length control protein FliK
VSVAVNSGSARGVNAPTSLVGTPIVPAPPTPADKPAAAGAQPPANRFAELLRRNRAETQKPTPPAPVHAPRADPCDSGETGATSAIEAKAAPANAAKARAAAPKGGDVQPVGDRAEAALERDAVSRDDRAETIDRSDGTERPTTTISPGDRVDFRPASPAAVDALRPLVSASAAAADKAARTDGEDRDAAAAGATAKPALGHARGMTAVDDANDRRARPIDVGRDAALHVATDARFHVTTGESLGSFDSPAASPSHERTIDMLASSLGVGLPSPGPDRVTSMNPTALALPTPVDAPDFAAALGVQVSVLVQDGIQQAELHLNPDETGPVSVHITLDGTAARVDFGADVAATRAAIERGLPELASALRDAGFTLAGGGVSQHANGRAGGDDEARRATAGVDGPGRPASNPIAAESLRIARALAAGGIDLYA